MKHVRHIIEFLILFAINGVMFWFFQGYLNFLFGIFMLILLIYSLISVHIVAHFLSLDLAAPVEYLTKKTEFLLTIRLENKSVLSLVSCQIHLRTGNVFAGEGDEHILTVPVRARGTTKVQVPLTSAYVGDIQVMAETLELEDLLGMHTVRVAVNKAANVYVIPSTGTGEEYSLNDFEKGMDEVEESKLAGSDFTDVSQVREYIAGDAMKNIHWKLSAKRETLMVKERLHMSSRKLLVVFALDRGEIKTVDETVERVYGFGKFFLANRVPITLFWWSDKYNEIKQDTAETEEEWIRLMIQLFHGRAGNGFVEENYRTMNPGKGYVRIGNDGIHVAG